MGVDETNTLTQMIATGTSGSIRCPRGYYNICVVPNPIMYEEPYRVNNIQLASGEYAAWGSLYGSNEDIVVFIGQDDHLVIDTY